MSTDSSEIHTHSSTFIIVLNKIPLNVINQKKIINSYFYFTDKIIEAFASDLIESPEENPQYYTGAPNFGKTWGIICFNQGRPKFQNLGGFTYRAANVSKFRGLFFAANYIETRGLI